MRLMLIAFLILPIIEIALFIVVGGAIGLWPTLGLVLLSAAAGIMIMQNSSMIFAAQQNEALSSPQTNPSLGEFGFKLVAGVLLLIPGFFTDILGILLLLPPTRAAIGRQWKRRFPLPGSTFTYGSAWPKPQRARQSQIIETDYEVVSDDEASDDPTTRRPSGWTQH